VIPWRMEIHQLLLRFLMFANAFYAIRVRRPEGTSDVMSLTVLGLAAYSAAAIFSSNLWPSPSRAV